MTEKRIASARPLFPEEDLDHVLAEIRGVLRGGRLILGPKAKALEQAYAQRLGVKHAITVASGTAALETVYRYYAKPDQEIIVPTNTFVATATAVHRSNARIVFAETDNRDFSIDVEDALSRVTENTAAIVAVHLGGLISSDLDRLKEGCRDRGIALVEDCAHAHGATYRGQEAGALTDAACFSFYSTKVLTSGTGGMITTNDDDLAAYARSMRHHGQGRTLQEIIHEGNDWVLDEVRAVLLQQQLRRLDEFVAKRRAVAARYRERLTEHPSIRPPILGVGVRPAFFKYPIMLPEGFDRDKIKQTMRHEYGIETGALYSPPCHLMPVFRDLPGSGPGALPKTESILTRQMCLPVHAGLEPKDADEVIDVLLRVMPTARLNP